MLLQLLKGQFWPSSSLHESLDYNIPLKSHAISNGKPRFQLNIQSSVIPDQGPTRVFYMHFSAWGLGTGPRRRTQHVWWTRLAHADLDQHKQMNPEVRWPLT